MAYRCTACGRTFDVERYMLSHVRQSTYCWEKLQPNLDGPRAPAPVLDDFDTLEDDPHIDDDIDALADELAWNLDAFEATLPLRRPDLTAPAASSDSPPRSTEPPPRHTDQVDTIDLFPQAGKVLHRETAVYDRWRQKHGHADNPYHPFTSKLDWEVGRWAIQEGPGASSLDRLLKRASVRLSGSYSFYASTNPLAPRSRNGSTYHSQTHASSTKSSTTS